MATGKAKSKAWQQAQNRWVAKVYDRIAVLVPKGDRDSIADAAKAAGQSTNAYIVQAVNERMQADQARMAEDRQS